jgi:hypothetical protein
MPKKLSEPPTTQAPSRDALASALAAAQQAHDEVRTRFDTLIYNGKTLGYEADLDAAEAELPELKAAEGAVTAARAALTEYDGKAASEVQRRQDEAERQRVPSIPAKARRYAQAATSVRDAAQALGAAFTELAAAGRDLAGTIGTQDAHRVFSLVALEYRVRHCISNFFTMQIDNAALRALRGQGAPFRFFVPASAINAADGYCKKDLVTSEMEVLDAQVHVFDSAEDAELARRRRDPSGATVHVRREPGGLYTLVSGVRRTLPGEEAA